MHFKSGWENYLAQFDCMWITFGNYINNVEVPGYFVQQLVSLNMDRSIIAC